MRPRRAAIAAIAASMAARSAISQGCVDSRARMVAVGCTQGREFIAIAVDRRHHGAALQQGLDCRAANAAGSARHHDDAVAERSRSLVPGFRQRHHRERLGELIDAIHRVDCRRNADSVAPNRHGNQPPSAA